MNKYLYILIFISFIFSSCNKEKSNARLFIAFEAVANGNTFDLNNTFTDSQGRSIKAELVKFYISNIVLVSDKDEEVFLKDITLFDLNNDRTIIELSVPKGKYSKIKFGIGVPDSLNEADPANYSEADHPLSITQNTYWGMNSMYRFFMIDGRYDLEPDGTFDGIFSYHTGFSFSYRNMEFNTDLELKRKDEQVLTFTIDVTKILEGPGGNLDIINEANYHGDPADNDLADMISNNVIEAITLKQN
jgi:hypothetical protein